MKHNVPCIAWNLTSDDHLEIDGDGVWPGQLAVLLPPPLDHERHVEAKQEGDGHARALCAAPPAGVGGGYKEGSDTDNWICTRDHPSIAHQRFALLVVGISKLFPEKNTTQFLLQHFPLVKVNHIAVIYDNGK